MSSLMNNPRLSNSINGGVGNKPSIKLGFHNFPFVTVARFLQILGRPSSDRFFSGVETRLRASGTPRLSGCVASLSGSSTWRQPWRACACQRREMKIASARGGQRKNGQGKVFPLGFRITRISTVLPFRAFDVKGYHLDFFRSKAHFGNKGL